MSDNSLPILTYHSIDTSGSVVSVSPQKFKEQMELLRRKAFQPLLLSEALKCFREGKNIPSRSVAITFDDGLRNVFTHARPQLTKRGFPATIFLVPDYCGATNQWPGQLSQLPVLKMMDWSEIQEMMRNGFVFGAHTLSHPDLSNLKADEVLHEIIHSKKVIEEKLEQRIELFAYPYGTISNECLRIVKQNFIGACSTEMGIATKKSNPYLLPRIDMYYFSNNKFFSFFGTPVFDFYVVVRKVLRLLRRGIFC